MFNFFKKKSEEQPVIKDITPGPVAEKQIQIDDIAIHTMPERFRHQPVKANSAKTTGIIIIGGGVVFLILVSAGVYYFLFRKPSVTVKIEPPIVEVAKPIDQNQVQPENNQIIPEPGTLNGTTTEPVILPIDDIATLTATSTPGVVEEDLNIGLTPGLDSDSDGLTDAEEILLGSGTSTPDTDGDLYLDGAEMLNLYNPAGSDKLVANPSIAIYENKTFSYSVLYPNAWQTTVNGGDDSIMFRTPDNQFFQIISQPNTGGQSLDNWYIDQLGVAFINDIDRLNGINWQGIKSSDGLTLYLMDLNQKNILTLAYNPGENNILEYINIFNMMIKSFTLK